MRRIAIGLVAGVAVWVGSAVAAEAQTIQIQPIGPTALKATDVNAFYVAKITPNSTNTYYVQVEVFVNGVSRLITAQDHFSTVGTKTYRKTIDISSLGLQPNDIVVFRCECGWSSTSLPYTADSPSITVGS
jgi:hypothetical protein